MQKAPAIAGATDFPFWVGAMPALFYGATDAVPLCGNRVTVLACQ